MTDREWQQLEQTISEMSDAEKRALIDRVARSLNGQRDRSVQGDEMTPEEQRQFTESIQRIASLPLEGPGGFSGQDHDEALYGPDSPKTNFHD